MIRPIMSKMQHVKNPPCEVLRNTIGRPAEHNKRNQKQITYTEEKAQLSFVKGSRFEMLSIYVRPGPAQVLGA